MNSATARTFAYDKQLGTEVPKRLKAFDWQDRTTRTICAKGRFRNT